LTVGYDFDRVIERRGTGCEKWDALPQVFGTDDLLPFWVADMDFAVAPEIAAAVQARAMHSIYGYHTREESFFEAARAWEERRHGWKVERDWITNTPGVVTSLAAAVRSLTAPGDKVVIQPPIYPPFFSCVTRNGRRLVENPLRVNNGRWEMDLADLEAKLDPSVKMLILCSPHNPVGRVWKREELIALGEICRRYDLTVLADEIHCDLVLPGHRHLPFAALDPELASRTVTFFSPSKTFNIAGTYTSLVVIPDPERRARYRELVRALEIDQGNLFGMVAAEAAFRYGEAWLEGLLTYLEVNAARLVSFAGERLPGVEVRKPEGTYLAWMDFGALAGTQERLKSFLIGEAKVGLSDGLVFGERGRGFARFNFGCPRSLLEEGLGRIAAALRKRGGKIA
jgi:cysteine-S-conjugate beta-lyase